MSSNPYESPSTTSFSPRRCALTLLGLLAWVYPIAFVGSFYGLWLVAWLSLGHQPRPSADDPKSIGVVVDALYFVPGLLMIGFPAGVLLGVILQFLVPNRSPSRKLLCGVLLIGFWLATIAFLRWDPMRIAEWYMD